MGKLFTKDERIQLIVRHRGERDTLVRDRIKAVLAYDDGYTYSEISRLLLLDDETIRRHINDFITQHKLAPFNGGSTSKLSDEESEKLISHLKEKTYLYVKNICAYVKQEFKVTYSISGMTKWLHLHSFCYKNPHGVPAKADAIKQREFIKLYEDLKNSLKSDELIYFSDSSHPQHQTRLSFGWMEKGVRKAEKMTACQKRVNIIGAINLANHDVAYAKVDWVNKESIKAFFEQLSRAHPLVKTIHIILDNAGYHRSKEVMEAAIKNRIKLHYLPPYSPNLNPIERLWKIMHEQVTYNRYYVKFSDFTEGICGFFENISQYKSVITSRINDNFQTLVMLA